MSRHPVTKIWLSRWESLQEEEQALKEKEESAGNPNAVRRKPARGRHSVESESEKEKEQRDRESTRDREQAQERERKKSRAVIVPIKRESVSREEKDRKQRSRMYSVEERLLRSRNSVRSETNTASGREGATQQDLSVIHADDDQQKKNTERGDLLVLVLTAIAKFNEKGRDATKLRITKKLLCC
jgi:hypothetical protein